MSTLGTFSAVDKLGTTGFFNSVGIAVLCTCVDVHRIAVVSFLLQASILNTLLQSLLLAHFKASFSQPIKVRFVHTQAPNKRKADFANLFYTLNGCRQWGMCSNRFKIP